MKFLLPILLFFSIAANATTYYVSNNGSNSNNGTSTATPFLTIAKANSVIVDYDSIGLQADNIFIEQIVLSASNITFDSFGTGAKPIWTGFKTATGFIQNGNIWSTYLTDAAPYLNTVKINGSMALKARYPNGNNSYLTFTGGSTTTLTVSAADTSHTHAGDEIAVRTAGWLIDTRYITNKVGLTLTISPSLTYSPTSNSCNGYFPMNDSAFVDSTNEYYYNTSTGRFIVYSETTPDVQYSIFDTVLRIGSKTNITINNITMSGGNRAFLICDSSSNVLVQNSTLKETGYYGWTRARKTNHLTFLYDSLIDNLNDGIMAGTIIPDSCRFLTVKHCYFKRTALLAGMGFGDNGCYIGIIKIGGDSALIEDNYFDTTGGIAVYTIGVGDSVKHNAINHSMLNTIDGGAIYTYGLLSTGSNDGLAIIGNTVLNTIGQKNGTDYVHNPFVFPAAAIYLDGGTRGTSIKDNVIKNCDPCVMLNTVTYIALENNILDDSTVYNPTIRMDAGSNNTLSGNIIVQRNSSYRLLNSTSITASDYNYWIRPSDTSNIISNGTSYSLSGWQTATGFDTHSAQSPTNRMGNSILTISNPNSTYSSYVPIYAYIDVYGNIYPGAIPIILAPYKGKVLCRYYYDFIKTETFFTGNH